jgi:hypothetical protein
LAAKVGISAALEWKIFNPPVAWTFLNRPACSNHCWYNSCVHASL